MFSSPILRKIMLIILTVSLGGILIMGIILSQTLNNQFQSYLLRTETAQQQETLKNLVDLYVANGGWQGQRFVPGPGRMMGNLCYVTDQYGQIVIATRRFRRHGGGPGCESTNPVPIIVGGVRVGTAYFGKSMVQNVITTQDRIFRRAIKQSIFWSVLLTGLLSMVVAVVFARRFSRPITAMNDSAKNMINGNLETRIQELPRDELGELGSSLNLLAERLIASDELRKKMTADAAHDLRTPLATVKSHLEGMIDQVIPSSRQNLESLLEEVDRLTMLVNDLQAIADADTTIQQFHYESIELKDFLEDLTHKLEPLFRQKNIGLNLAEVSPVTLKLDRPALAKIMQNLLANALKFTPGGKQVIVKAIQTGSSVIIEVIDQGIGISPQDLPYIFERFYRADPSRNRESGGFGLGLTIVKELTEAMGGLIEVESAVGEGSTFKVKFPVILTNHS
jgi:signal transduction histidine kinase